MDILASLLIFKKKGEKIIFLGRFDGILETVKGHLPSLLPPNKAFRGTESWA